MRRAARVALAMMAMAALGTPAAVRADDAAPDLPNAIYGASASGTGVVAVVDAAAVGGAVYVANLSSPFADANVSSGPSSEAVGSYAFDNNAATGLYYVVASLQDEDDALKLRDIPNTAAARYPGRPTARTSTPTGIGRRSFPEIPTEVPVEGVGAVGAVTATAEAQADRASADARSAYLTLSAIPVSTAAQSAVASVSVRGESLISHARAVVHDLTVGPLHIGTVVGESHIESTGPTFSVRSTLRVVDASVGTIPVTIGSDGVRAIGSEDRLTPGAIADLNRAVRQRLTESGISVAVLESVTSDQDGASAATPGLRITVPIAEVAVPNTDRTVPGGTVSLIVGRTEAAGSLSPIPDLPPVVVLPVPPMPPTIVTIIEPGFSPPPEAAVGPVAMSQVALRDALPLVGLFALWQLSAFGSVLLAWWNRGRGAAP